MEDAILSEFIRRTNAEPSFAQDVLNTTEWNLEAAIAAYYVVAPSASPRSAPAESAETTRPSTTATQQEPAQQQGRSRADVAKAEWHRHRAMSLANRVIVGNMQRIIRGDDRASHGSADSDHGKFACLTMCLPSFEGLPASFAEFLRQDLIDVASQAVLDSSGKSAMSLSVFQFSSQSAILRKRDHVTCVAVPCAS